MTDVKQPKARKKTGLRIIAYLKLVSALLLLTLAFGIFHLLGRNVGSPLEHYVRMLHIDTDNRLITDLLAKLSGISALQLRRAGTVTLIYAALYIIEGIGLFMAKKWAEYLTIIMTAALIPLEIYEIVLKPSLPRILILLINILIVGYLIYRPLDEKRRKES